MQLKQSWSGWLSFGELEKCGGTFVWTALSSVDLMGAPDAPA